MLRGQPGVQFDNEPALESNTTTSTMPAAESNWNLFWYGAPPCHTHCFPVRLSWMTLDLAKLHQALCKGAASRSSDAQKCHIQSYYIAPFTCENWTSIRESDYDTVHMCSFTHVAHVPNLFMHVTNSPYGLWEGQCLGLHTSPQWWQFSIDINTRLHVFGRICNINGRVATRQLQSVHKDPTIDKAAAAFWIECERAIWKRRSREVKYSGQMFYRTLTMNSWNTIFACPRLYLSMCYNWLN